MINLNARFLTQKLTGTQRFGSEIVKRIYEPEDYKLIMPDENISSSYENPFANFEIKKVGSFSGVLWDQLSLPQYLKKEGNGLLVNFCNTAPLNYSNKIISIMDISPLKHPEWFTKGYSSYYKFLLPKIVKTSKHIFTISEYSKSEIVEYFNLPEEKIEVIHCAISENLTVIEEKNEQATLEKYDLNSVQYVLGVSSLDPRKNFPNLIKSFCRLKQKELRLVLVGSMSSMFKNQKLEENLNDDRVRFLGYVNDSELAIIYKNALCFAYPSYYEGFGMPPLEAMYYGCPVLTSNVTSLPEVCGDAALYIDPYNTESITNGLNEIIENHELRKTLVKHSKEQIKKFNWNHSASKVKQSILRISQSG